MLGPLLKLLVALAEELQQHREQVDEVEIELQRPKDGRLASVVASLQSEVAVLGVLAIEAYMPESAVK